MKCAMIKSLPTVAASAATTVIGFSALMFMRFGIGADLGLNLVKGVMFSFVAVMIFLPVVTLMCYKLIDRTQHRSFMPGFDHVGGLFMKIRIPCLILAFVLVVPCFLAQSNNEFLYGMGSVTNTSRVGHDTALIDAEFGKLNQLVLLVPREGVGKEAELCAALSKVPRINQVLSYATAVGAEIPAEFVPAQAIEQFYSPQYARVILYADTSEEGVDAFETVEAVYAVAAQYYDETYMTGQSATLYDMEGVVSIDIGMVNLIAVVGIFIVLLLTFRSLTIPLFLLFTIETAIWICLSYSYFAGQPISFIGYLIIIAVQLGATVDYAILFTNNYMHNRKTLPKREAMRTTIGDNFSAILISATILATAGFTLALTSTNPIISELGSLLGRGTLLSLTMVACVLPALLVLFDRVIQKTTLKHAFYSEEART